MAQIPISAYYYSEEEKETILSLMTPLEETDCFLFGVVEPATIASLKNSGILVDMHVDPAAPSVSLNERVLSSQPGSRSVKPFVTPRPQPRSESAESQLHTVQLIGPLLSTWKQQLEEVNIEIEEALQNGIYLMKAQEASDLDNLPFIKDHQPYTLVDKEITVQRAHARAFDPFAPETVVSGLFDILVHREEQVDELIAFLNDQQIPVTEQSRVKVRARLSSEEQLLNIGQLGLVKTMEEYVKPELHNDVAREIIHIDVPNNQAYRRSEQLTGENELVGVADTGIDENHPDLQDRISGVSSWGRKNDASDPNGHGTHVAGSIVGTGAASDGVVRGMAPEAQVFFQSLLDPDGGIGGIPHDLSRLFQEAYDAGVRIHNNSWGSATESVYRFNSLEVDAFIYEKKDMLIVISAGNEGTARQPRRSNPGFVDWLSLGSPATAKNGLTVGASRSSRSSGGFSTLTYGQAWPNKYPQPPIRDANVSGNEEGLAAFSSRGPCGNESRIKPDVVAPGTDIASTRSSQAPMGNFWGPYPRNRKYGFMGGTSMSAPVVSGFAALIRQHLRVDHNYSEPSAALLKAIIINGTRTLEGTDSLADHDFTPNFHQGFGCVDLQNILPSEVHPGLSLQYVDSWKNSDLLFQGSGQRFIFSLEVGEGTPLRLCLCWTDPPGPGIQNNLNLWLQHRPSGSRWVGNEHIPRMITSFDRDNNVEIIRIDDPEPGEYRIAVQAANLLVGNQDFAFAITGNLETTIQQLN